MFETSKPGTRFSNKKIINYLRPASQTEDIRDFVVLFLQSFSRHLESLFSVTVPVPPVQGKGIQRNDGSVFCVLLLVRNLLQHFYQLHHFIVILQRRLLDINIRYCQSVPECTLTSPFLILIWSWSMSSFPNQKFLTGQK